MWGCCPAASSPAWSSAPASSRPRSRCSCASFLRRWPRAAGSASRRIHHFNGGLFDDDTALRAGRREHGRAGRVAAADWGAIEPSIFGTLFERGLDPDKRSQLGAHYTGKDDILLVVEPVLMAPLRRRWARYRPRCACWPTSLARSMRPPMPSAPPRRARNDEANAPCSAARRWRCWPRSEQKLAAVQMLDPACGSGNFLYVALLAAARPGERGHQSGGDPRAEPIGLPLVVAGAAPRHRDQSLRLRAGPGHDLDRLHPMAARQRLWIADRADPQAADHLPPDGRDPGRRDRGSGTSGSQVGTGVAGGGRDHRESAVFGRPQDASRTWAMRTWMRSGSSTRIGCRVAVTWSAIGLRRREP